MNLQVINRGSAPGAKDGDTAYVGGGKINDNFAELAGLMDILTRIDIITDARGFSISGTDVTVNADWQWYINNELYTNPAAVVLLVALSSAGMLRKVYVVPNDTNDFDLIEGDEAASNPPTPELPNGGMYVTFFEVSDSGIGTPSDPYNGDNLVNKEDKSNKNQPSGYAGLNSDGKVFGLENIDNTSDIDKPVSTAQAAADASVLTAANAYTDSGLALKLNAADYNDRFKGKFLTEAAMRAAYPTANVGDEAQVNEVGSETVKNFSWDDELNDWVQSGSGGSGATNTDALPEGSTNLYFTTTRVLASVLTGLSAASGTFTATDSILTAFGKIKYLIDNIATTYQAILVSGTNIKTINSGSILGSGDLDLNALYAPKSPTIVETGTSFTLDDTYNGKILILTASCTVTLPNGLVSGFGITIVTLASVTLTLATGGSVTLFNNDGTTMGEKLNCTIQNRTAANQYITAGNL